MSTTAQIKKVLSRDGDMCVLALEGCLGTATCADHRANRGHGGSTVLDAFPVLIAACVLCNNAKENATGKKLAELVRRGVRVLKAATNEATAKLCREIPVEYPDGLSYWLTLDGRKVAAGRGVEF